MTHASTCRPAIREDQARALLLLARQTIMSHFKKSLPQNQVEEMEARLQDPELQVQCGTFVTLKLGKQLRGCIGTLSQGESIGDGIRSNAINAAFHDPRFSPLSKEELQLISIEVSVLTPSQPLAYDDAEELIARLRPHVDGVTLRKGGYSATFLPQVWEQLPDVRSFLSHLCSKAGLAPDAWRTENPEVEVYQVQYFEE